MEKIEALAKFLECEIEDLKETRYDENTFETEDGEEYLVLTDSEADDYFHDSEENLLDELGLESFSDYTRDYVLENFVDTVWFDDAMNESNESYCDDIETENASSDEYENRLEEEMAENDCEAKEDYVEFLNSNYDDACEWYRDNFGMKEFSNVVSEYNLLDTDACIDWIMEEDGRGNELALYDGIENEYDDYFIYRVN